MSGVTYYGDFAEDDTVIIPFNTFSSDDPAASVTITNLADADVKVHKDGSATQIVTDGATVSIDFDTITGNHLVTIDTSAHADYSTGSEYQVRIEGTTVDAGTVNAFVGCFSIERAGGVLALIKAGNLSANVVQLGGVTQSLTDLKAFADSGYDPATSKVQGVVLTDTVTTYTGNTLQTADVAARVPNVLNTTALGNIGVDWANVENPTTALDLSGTDIQLCDTITTYTGNTKQTGDTYVLANGATGFAAIDTVVDSILVDTAEIGVAGVGLTDLGGMSTGMKAEVNVEAKDVLFTDTDAEPAQGTPAATATLAYKISYMYKALRNRVTTTATSFNIYNDDAVTIDHKATTSDNGTTADRNETVSGP